MTIPIGETPEALRQIGSLISEIYRFLLIWFLVHSLLRRKERRETQARN